MGQPIVPFLEDAEDALQQKIKRMGKKRELQKDINNAIKCDPLLGAFENGVITNKRIIGLPDRVDDLSTQSEKEDGEIFSAVAYALRWNWGFSYEKVNAKVEDGWVTLEGELNWDYQKEVANNITSNLPGVKGVINNIKIEPDKSDAIDKNDTAPAIRPGGQREMPVWEKK